jgi:hypothetical protein
MAVGTSQSQFPRHFKRLIGITPGQFRRSARIAEKAASLSKNPGRDPSTIQPGLGRVAPELRNPP